jgi:hypothetical protein
MRNNCGARDLGASYGHNVPKRVYWAIMFAFVDWAMFLVWRDERIAVQQLQRERDHLRRENTLELIGRIDETITGVSSVNPDNTGFILTVSIRNLGMQSIATGWRLKLNINGTARKKHKTG